MLNCRFLVPATAALVALTFVACQDGVVAPEEVDAPQFRRGRVIESVTGGGNFTDFRGDFRTFTVSAKKFADGSVIGQWERVNHRGGGAEAMFKSHGVVTCFNNIGSSVLMGGYATSGRLSTPPNNEVRWHVVDNGPGATDQNSLQFVGQPPGIAALWCDGVFGLNDLNDVTQGNITVR